MVTAGAVRCAYCRAMPGYGSIYQQPWHCHACMCSMAASALLWQFQELQLDACMA